MNLKTSLLIALLLLINSCKYKPFVKYQFQNKKTNLPSFKKKDFLRGSSNSLRNAYDLTKYDWSIKPDAEKKSLQGTMIIGFKALSSSKQILLDMHRRLKIDEISCASTEISTKRKGDFLYINFAEELIPNKNYEIEIKYHGKPVSILDEGPMHWKKSKNGKDWISTITEGLGPHYIMPCKLLLDDEPEICIIRVETDKDLVGVANGKLDSITQLENTQIFHHSVRNPINNYNISFNIGDYDKLEKYYTDINGIERTIEVYTLKEDYSIADTFYNDLPLFMGYLEDLYGPFPWWNDGCKFIQTALDGGAMEHQSAISMGSRYYYDYIPPGKKHINTTVIHELAHEWWGNMITCDDYAHMWIHEGMATYSELLVIEKIYGKRYYDWTARRVARFVRNERPLLKTEDVLYNSWANDKDNNIYYKGCMIIHTLRCQYDNDSLFLEALKMATSHFALQNINSLELEEYLNEVLKTDYSWLFNIYLRNTEVPVISYGYDSIESRLQYKWSTSIPNQEKLKVFALNSEGEKVTLNPTNQFQEIQIAKGKSNLFDQATTGYVFFRNIGIRTE